MDIGQVIYKVGLYGERGVSDETKRMTKNNENRDVIVNQVNEIDKALDDVEFELIFNAHSSLFKPVDKIAVNEFHYKMAVNVSGGFDLRYKDLKEKVKVVQKNYSGQLINIVKPFNEYEWEITKETKRIGGYECYKAITRVQKYSKARGKELIFDPIVWFTPDIPVPFGPKGLDGLPGLVMEASVNGRVYFYATRINLKQEEQETAINIFKGGKEITEEEYEELLFRQMKDRSRN